MFRFLHRLFGDLFTLRAYRLQRQRRLPWWVRLPYRRNRVRHAAQGQWPGGYVMTENNDYLYVPAELDVMSSRRLLRIVGEDPMIARWCRPGDVAVDAGANIGDWALPMAKAVGPAGRLVAVEPIPRMAEALRKTFGANRLLQAQVAETALSDTPGSAVFSVERHNSGGSRLGEAGPGGERVQVAVTTLDELLIGRLGLPRVDFLKVDVEGHERAVLAGAAEVLARWKPMLLMESGQESAGDRRAIADRLQGLGYRIGGMRVAGGMVEVDWASYREGTGLCAEAGIVNILFF